MSIDVLPEEILSNIIQEAASDRTPSGFRVIVTPKNDYTALEKAQDILLACRLVSKKFNRVATRFNSPQFHALLPTLLAVAKDSAQITEADLNSNTIGHAVCNLSDFLWLKRLRHSMPYITDKLFTKSEDRAKAKSLFGGLTYLSANPEVYATFKVPNDPERIVVLESFRLVTQFVKFFGGVVRLKENEKDILSVPSQRLRKLFGSTEERFMGDLARQDFNVKTKFLLNRSGINNLATVLGCPEWMLVENEKQFLLPRFLLAVNGFPNLALSLKAENFYVIKNGVNPVLGSPLVANKIPLSESEVPPMIELKRKQYPAVELFRGIQQSVIDHKPTFHSYKEVTAFYTLLKNFVDAHVVGSLHTAGLSSYLSYDQDVNNRKKLVKLVAPLIKFTRFRSTFVEGPKNPTFDFVPLRMTDWSFKIVFSDSLQLKVDVERFVPPSREEMLCIYISGVGWTGMAEILREKNAERLMISFVEAFKPQRRVYPNYQFRYPEIIKIIDQALNQFVVATNFTFEVLLNCLILDVEDDVRITDQMCSPYSLEVLYGSPVIKFPEDGSDSDSDNDYGEEEFDSEDSEMGSEYRSEDSDDSYVEDPSRARTKNKMADSDSDDGNDSGSESGSD